MEFKDFLNPNATLTPGVAGSMTMMISNTFASQFEVLATRRPEIGLLVSFLFGLVVITAITAMPIWQRAVYYVLNSLVIFTVAVGSNTLGVAATKGGVSSAAVISSVQAQTRPEFRDNQIGWCCLNHRVNPSSWEECEKWGGQFSSSQEEAERICFTNPKTYPHPPPPPPSKEQSERFFRSWF